MLRNLLILVFQYLIFAVSAQNSAISCIKRSQFAYGHPTKGSPTSDYNYLKWQESTEHYFRMRGIKLCSTTTGDLVGLQAYVGKYS